jgi:hypothetical protein
MLGYHGMNSAGVAHFSNALAGGPRNQIDMPEYVYEPPDAGVQQRRTGD